MRDGTCYPVIGIGCLEDKLHGGDIKFKSMQHVEDLGATDDAFDPSECKRERRIKSGADVIIRGVL
jgi:hypothetical protein